MKKLLKVKDDIIWNLIAEKRSIFEKNVHDIEEKYRNEAAEMFKFVQFYESELNKVQLVCHFCGLYVDDKVVNSACHKNASDVIADLRGNFTVSPVPPENINTKRHFFGHPKNVYIL
jgi:hypothetical protein